MGRDDLKRPSSPRVETPPVDLARTTVMGGINDAFR